MDFFDSSVFFRIFAISHLYISSLVFLFLFSLFYTFSLAFHVLHCESSATDNGIGNYERVEYAKAMESESSLRYLSLFC